MSDEEQQCPECKPGLPGWLATFADLMSLLMCFFVLLLSFAEMDIVKFQRLAGSMKNAFGVQNQVDTVDIPKGTSIIAQEFSPGKPEPTPIVAVMQITSEPTQSTLEVLCETKIKEALEKSCPQQNGAMSNTKSEAMSQTEKESAVAELKELMEKTEAQAMEIAAKLDEQIQKSEVEVESSGRRIVIRLQEKGSFDSGSAQLKDAFVPVIVTVGELLKGMDGQIGVEGHSDSIPIRSRQFPSNWHLSTARALTVATGLMYEVGVDPARFSVSGFADTVPLAENDNAEHRARNRRVEIILMQPLDPELREKLRQAREANPRLLEDKQLQRFELSPGEVF